MAESKMPWFKFHSQAPDDEKVHALTGELGDPGADVYLYRLWAYCGRRKPNGRFAKATAVSVIESGAGWKGERGRLVDVLLAVGLLDDMDEEYEVHKWPEYQSALVARFDADKKRPPGRTRPKAVPTKSRAGHERDMSGTFECPDEVPRGVSPLSTLVVASRDEGAGEETAPGELMDRLHAAFHDVCGHGYSMDRRDEGALRVLQVKARQVLPPGADERAVDGEIERRFRLGLARKTYPRVKALWELPNAWNHCGAAEATAQGFTKPASTGFSTIQYREGAGDDFT